MEITWGFGKSIDKRSKDNIVKREIGIVLYSHTWDRVLLVSGRVSEGSIAR